MKYYKVVYVTERKVTGQWGKAYFSIRIQGWAQNGNGGISQIYLGDYNKVDTSGAMMAAATGESAKGAMTTVSQWRCRQWSCDQKGQFFRTQELSLCSLALCRKNGWCCFHRQKEVDPEKRNCLHMTLSLLLWWYGHWKPKLHDLLKVCHGWFC